MDAFLYPEVRQMAAELTASTGPRYRKLNEAVAGLIEDYSMVSYLALDISEEESIGDVLAQIDHSIQFGEDADVKIRDEPEPPDLDGDRDMD